MTTETTRTKLGKLASLIGFGVMSIAGLINLDNLDKMNTTEYSLLKRDTSWATMIGASSLMLGGLYIPSMNKYRKRE